MRIRLHEPAVALTDLAIGLEAWSFAFALGRPRPAETLPTPREAATRRWFVVFFAATGLAAIVGALLHGLLPPDDREAPARRRAWRVSLGAIGVAGLSAWCLAALLALPRAGVQRVMRVATGAHLAYLGDPRAHEPAVRGRHRDLSAGRGGPRRSTRAPYGRSASSRRPASLALGGLGLTFVAAGIQVRHIAIHPRLFDHNATYHTAQAIAVACFFAAARRFVRVGQDTGRK